MKRTKLLQILFVWCLGLCMFSCQSPQTMLTSPDGQLSLEFTLDEEGTPIYCLKRAGKDVLLPSRLGLALKDAPSLVSGFAFYEKYGVHQVKTGYVGDLLDGKERHSSQFGVLHYRKVIEAAARHHICIDNHEPVIPTGLQRTYPNLMTQEGVRGQEWDASEADYETNPTAIEIEEREVTNADTLSIWQARSGGTAIQLCPLEEQRLENSSGTDYTEYTIGEIGKPVKIRVIRA